MTASLPRAIAIALFLLSMGGASFAAPLTITYRGKTALPVNNTTDQNATNFPIAGLSGITHRGGNNFTAVMDNSNKLVNLTVTFNANGSINTATVTGGYTLDNSRDHEGIAFTNNTRNSVFVSEEVLGGPKIYEHSLDGSGDLLQTVTLSGVFDSQRANLGLESLTRRPDGSEMWTANEEALTDDGPASTNTATNVVRLQKFSVSGNTLTAAGQFAYNVDAIHMGLPNSPQFSGLVDLVSLPDGRLLALERSALNGFPVFRSRIYQLDFAGATDISTGSMAAGLIGETYNAVGKTLLYDSTTNPGENLEGLTLGPQLSGGNYVLLGIVDDGDQLSNNTLVSFEITGVPEPAATLPMTMGGMMLAAGFVFKRRQPLAA